MDRMPINDPECKATWLVSKQTYAQIFLRTTPRRFIHFELPMVLISVVSVAICSMTGADSMAPIMLFIATMGFFLTYWSRQGKRFLEAVELNYGPKTRVRIWKLCSGREAELSQLDVPVIANSVGEQSY
ncbi:hypothetical protein [Pseudomonas brenneri]|uniref:hypothetical protein n=1 Tax=Pseudomonas brenneri TaxID=129817 RepID=UPI003BA06619